MMQELLYSYNTEMRIHMARDYEMNAYLTDSFLLSMYQLNTKL